MVLLGGSAIMGAGFFVVIATNRKRREITKEKLQARLALLPLLQAEQDRR
jgi:NADH dehydrogenase (ubiquinone) 1 alpha subcomplex subunit 13